MSGLRLFIALCIPVLAGACGAVLPRGIVEAARLDPLNTPPEALALAVSVPDTVVLRDGDAVIRMALTAGGETLVDSSVPLSVDRAPETLLGGVPEGDTVYAASLTPQNAATLAATQAEIRSLRAAGTTGKGTLSIAVVGGCRTGAPLETLFVSTWLRPGQSAPFVPLTRRVDVLDQVNDTGAVVAPCEE